MLKTLNVEEPAKDGKEEQFKDKSISVEEAVKTILEVTDKRARKVFFPTKAWYGYYLRPIFPNFVDRGLKKRLLAKL